MRRYIEHIQHTHTPHERRQHAMRVASVITALLFIAWLAALGVRIAYRGPIVNDQDHNTAATLNAVQDGENSTLLGY